MKLAPLIAIVFAFFLIAIYPIYSEDGINENLTYSDEDNDGITSDKDKCPEENASGKDIDEDGCIDSEITKEEVDYLERLAKINLGQYILFAIISLFSTAIYWERERITALLTDKDELSVENYKSIEGNDIASEELDYDDLGKEREINIQKDAKRSRLSFSFAELNAEANNAVQIMALICIITFIFIPEFSWLNVEGTRTDDDFSKIDFEVKHYSNILEHVSGNETKISSGYISSDCTNDIDKIHNCNYRSSLFYTLDNIISISILLCTLLILLAFRAEKYRKIIAVVFSLNLIIAMSILLIFTALIGNALEADEPLIDSKQSTGSGCWMKSPVIWGEGNCVGMDEEGNVYSEIFTFSPGIAYYLILICISILFLGWFTAVEPLLESKKISWANAMKNNWQVFAIIAVTIFLWRVNVLINNI
ncbi:MAG TPA: hypothetical protein QF644_00205 [Candidatus Poseidoniaceae archaeon]|nr:hypothetical protein [Candidatus Poseidoniaceae archaeon]